MEDDFKYILESSLEYPVSHETIAKYITGPKKISVKKVIEQNNLVETTDFKVTTSDEYSFTLIAFKTCIANYKCKFIKTFFTIEDNYYKSRVSNPEKKDAETSVNISDEVNAAVSVVNSVSNEVNEISEELLDKINNIELIINKISSELNTLPSINNEIKKLSELGNISKKLDKIIDIDISKYLESHSKKIKTINIL